MEPASTLADALLDDLDDLSDVEEETAVKEEKAEEESSTVDVTAKKPSALLDQVNAHLQHLQEAPDSYPLICQSNQFLAQLALEVQQAHGRLCEAYRPKFPELEELVPNPLQYQRAVQLIGNEVDLSKLALERFLTSNQVLTVRVSASTTAGRVLTADELDRVHNAVAYMDQVLEAQAALETHVSKCLEGLAPSVCALVGPQLAARLVGLAGGLEQLSKIPACNLQVLGKNTSQASVPGMPHKRPAHAGILSECDLVQSLPKAHHAKALKAVANKLALATRCDFSNVDSGRPKSAQAGLEFRRQLDTKFAKWQEPEKTRVLKALPKPDLTVKKRRGGKRMRRWKERFEETAMMKQANTRAFSEQTGEYGDDAMGLTMGLLEAGDAGGSLRKTTEKRKIRQANTKASRKRERKLQQEASRAASSGLASSMVFTPVQGMELVNPDAQRERKVREANQKWFRDNAGFQSALPKK